MADNSLDIPYEKPDIRLCAKNTTRIADLFIFLERANETYMREIDHTREVLSKDILLNRELMAKDLQALHMDVQNEMSKVKATQEEMKVQSVAQSKSISNLDGKVDKFYKTISGWALWLLGSIAISSVLMALNLLMSQGQMR